MSPSTNETITLPRPLLINNASSIPAPPESSFTSAFGSLLPPAQFLPSAWGTTAFYSLPAPSPQTHSRRTILIHGVGTPALGLLPLAKRLHPRAHVVLYDLWGHGLSSTPLTAHVPALFHTQLLHLLAHLRWDTADLVGYSFGGSVAATFAAHHPELVESVVLVAPGGFLRKTGITEEQRAFLRGGPGIEDQACAWILDMVNGGPLVVPPDWRERVSRGELVPPAIQIWERSEHQGHIPSVVSMLRDGGVFEMNTEFEKVANNGKTKGLAVLGEVDEIVNELDMRTAGWKDILVVPETGHGVVREKVEQVAEAIVEFWKRGEVRV